MEHFIENLMYRARWILAPVYLGLSLALLALGIKFFQEVWHLLIHIFTMGESDMVLVVLSLIDMAMVGGIIIMVMMGGYENFVSRLDVDGQGEKLSWLGKMDAAALKMKLATTIVAISSIHLLKMFMNVPNLTESNLLWYVIIHMTFVFSAVLMGYLDKISKH